MSSKFLIAFNSQLYVSWLHFAGGLWESGPIPGQTWTSVTDLLPALSIADITINPGS